MRVRVSLLVAVLFALPAAGEQAPVNIHLDPGVGTGLDRAILVSGATLKVDLVLLKHLPIAPQLEAWGMGAANRTYLDDGAAFGVGLGARLRLFNDEKGFFFNPGSKRTGNLWGNYWVDAHLTYTTGGAGFGFDVGTGYEFSMVEALSVGPFAKFMLMGPHSALMFGVSFTIGAPQTTPADADYDGDGIKGDDDKCVDEAGPKENNGCPWGDEDKDGVPDSTDKCPKVAGTKENNGCPWGDEDKDGLQDNVDKCPKEPGPKENEGCPWGDTDQDGLLDNVDKCPKQAGPKENEGCPDTDKDGDTVPDRLDKCPDEKGDPANAGCPWPDTDGDTVTDNVDNCPQEKGPPDNQGCPVAQKQLVVITREKLVIKDRVYFDFNKATLQARSFTLLDQIASILKGHPEIKSLQIEGHTDNVGDAAYNRKLSQDRADAVRAYLVKKGTEAERLKAVGFGPDKPADTNATPAGRDKNRRVEFNIVDQGAETTEPPPAK